MQQEIRELIERLFITESKHLFIYAEAVLQDYNNAEDAVQRTFEEALSVGDKLLEHPAPTAWLIKTLKYNLYDMEKEKLHAIRHFIDLEKADKLRDESTIKDPVGLTVFEIMRRIRADLSSEDFYILEQIVLKKAERAEVAKTLGISKAACQKRLERIRKHLRSIFPEY